MFRSIIFDLDIWPRNMSVLFKSITAASNCSLCPLISISKGTILVISLFFVLFVLKTSNEKFIGFIHILFSLTSCSLISMCMHLESTNALTLRFLLFFIFMFAYTFNSLSTLLYQFGTTYLFWEFTGEISCTVPTWDLLQNYVSLLSCYYLHHLILLESFFSSSIAFLCNLWQCVLLYHIWNISKFPSLSSFSIFWPYVCTCCNWSTSAFYLWSYHCFFQYP